MNLETLTRHDLDPKSVRDQLHEGPGVYLFKDRAGKIIYVGKAKNLKKRVSYYLRPPGELPHKTAIMMNRARGLDVILTTTEKEAFILESNLIKKHLPRYNIVLRDDKQYPWLRFDVKDPYPRMSVVRKPKRDGALYFGPFSSAQSVRKTLKLIDRTFQLRKCKSRGLPVRSRPCLNFQLERCLGPCSQGVSPDQYEEVVHQVRLFLEGRNLELVKALKKRMESAAESLDFEKAARIRDQIRAVERTVERQHVVSQKSEDQDVIGLAKKDGTFQLALLFIRKGCLMGSRDYLIRNKLGSPSEVIEAFLKQHYPREPFIPKQILISESVEDLHAIREWISEMAGRKVSIEHPSRGEKLRLTRMAVSNAQNLLATRVESSEQDIIGLTQSVLSLKNRPRSIEGFDISNISGDMAVGAVVSFVDGEPHTEQYRNYKIKNVEGIDDYAMMSELVSRRLSQGSCPDLLLVDGGKGHLRAAKKVADHVCGVNVPDLVAIAKADEKGHGEKVYIPGRKNRVSLRQDHPVLHLLMRIRDEAHRRAISYHRKLRGKSLKESVLDQIAGIGPKRKRRLLEHFGDVGTIARAKLEDIVGIKGISISVAENIAKFFHQG